MTVASDTCFWALGAGSDCAASLVACGAFLVVLLRLGLAGARVVVGLDVPRSVALEDALPV
jgi:hypothetical protein